MVQGEHSLCRVCRNVVRIDWEFCFHCGARAPIARPLAKRVFGATTALIVVGTMTIAAMKVGAVWGAVRAAPERLVTELAATATAAALPGTASDVSTPPTIVVPDPPYRRQEGSYAAVTPLTRVAQGGVPLTTLATSAAPDPAARADGAGRAFDEARVARVIAAAVSVPELDSLEARLHAEHPRDPRLRRDGRIGRRLALRRAALAGR